MKKLLSIILILCAVSLCGCQNGGIQSQSEHGGTNQIFSDGEYTGLWSHTEYPDSYNIVIYIDGNERIMEGKGTESNPFILK